MRRTSPKRSFIAGLAGFAVAISGLAAFTSAAPAAANPGGTGLVISEVYGAGGNGGAVLNADFVELYNPTNAAIPLAGKYIHYRSNGGGQGGNPVALSGSVPAHGNFLIQMSAAGANGAALPTPDQGPLSFTMAAGGGQVFLLPSNTNPFANNVNGNAAGNASIIDMVGANGASTFEGSATTAAATTTQSLNRSASGADTDNNTADFSLAAPTPTNATPVGGPLTVTDPSDVTATVGVAISAINLAATGGTGPYTWDVAGLPAGLSESSDGVITGTPTTVGASVVTVTAHDNASASDSEEFTITVNASGTVTSIADIQGTGATSPRAGDTVTTEGIVTALYPSGQGNLNGIYIQTAGTGGSTTTTPGASDAIFVFGNNSQPAGVEIGDSVKVTGVVSEFQGLTEITPGAGGVVEVASLGSVTPRTVVPGTDCALPGTDCLDAAGLDAAREAVEGEWFQPTGDYTVTDVYDGSPYNGTVSNDHFGEIGLAAESDLPLVQPTEVIDAQNTAGTAARKKYNDAHRMILDDGTSIPFWKTDNTGAMEIPFPWWTPNNQIRVGAGVTFPKPVILTYRNSTWKIQPQTKVTDSGSDRVAFEQNRPSEPEDVGGDLKLATFNVLNYFTTLGEDLAGCQPFNDRNGNPIAIRTGCDARGAWNDASFDRQESKIVHAINALGADIVSLEEIENSLKVDNHDRDEALSTLVDALNDDAGSDVWDYVHSPASASDPGNIAEQDVIRGAFIYKPATVALVGGADMLFDEPAFDNAREPFAQVFKAVGAPDADGFVVIVNHFKSKGSGTPDPFGQGNANADRVAQAEALSEYANDFADARGVDAIFLAGDFNAASQEDPMQVLYADGFESLDVPGKWSYNFDGQAQSLDHVVANEAAHAMVTGQDIWEINANETVFNQYSRYNYNATILYTEDPYSASDHNPEIIGIDAAEGEPATRDIQILATNDFHGRLENNPSGTEAGAAVLAGAVKQLRAQNPDTVFAAAGDLIGASTFTSFIQNDKPTIDALNEAGLEVSAVGNHELDKGYNDLINRVMKPYNASTNPQGGAGWQYIAANLKVKATGDPAVPATWVKSFGSVDVGFVGAVTEELPSLVSPAGIADIEVTDIVDSVNTAANDLVANGADVVVMLVHEGAPSTNCTTMDDAGAWADIINSVNGNVDAIVSGHTHLAYNCSFPVASWTGRPVTERPVVSAGQYGSALNKLVFSVDTATGDVTAKTQELLNLKTGQTPNYPSDGPTAAIVAAAVAAAGPLGNVELGQIGGVFSRAKFGDGTRENRGGESSLGNLVAEVQRWATEGAESGGAEIAFMNPGGLRADMVGNGTGPFPRTLTYKQAADVQPFANTLVNMDLSGANIKLALEQQWQRNANGTIPTRPFLKLGISEGFEYTYDKSLPEGSRITSMTLDGEPIDPGATYSVTVNSFLASGGDNFRAFTNGTGVADTGKIDLQAMVDYMAEFANVAQGDSPLPVDHSQRAVGVSFPGNDTSLPAGSTAVFDLSSLIMTGSVGTSPNFTVDPKDTQVTVSLDDGASLGSFPVDATIVNPGTGTGQADAASNDEAGTAHVAVVIPSNTTLGEHVLVVRGAATGTEVEVPITVTDVPSLSGEVRSSVGNALLPGVCVYLYTSESAPSASYATCTQPDGSYYIGGIAPGDYVVAVSDPSGAHETLWVEEPVDLHEAVSDFDLVMTKITKGSIAGTVTASNGPSAGGPVSNICVFAYQEDVSSAASYASCTGANGTYVLGGVETSHKYDVAFFDPSGIYPTKWANGTTGGATSQAGAVAVTVPVNGTVTVDMKLAVLTTGFMSGKVTDQANNPVGGVCVYLYRNTLAPAVAATCTAADGTWWIPNLTPGVNYRVGISDPAAHFKTHWYNGTAAGANTIFGATPQTVVAGQTTANINAKLTPVP